MWITVISNSLTAAALFIFSFFLVDFVRKPLTKVATSGDKWTHPRMLATLAVFFTVFCVLCGMTHVLSAVCVFYPNDVVVRDVQNVINAACALVAVATVGVCFAVLPSALMAPSRTIERKAGDNATHAEHYMLETVEIIQDSILVLSSNLNVVRENAATKDLFGSLSLIGKSILPYVHPADLRAFEQACQTALASYTSTPTTIEYRIKPTARIKTPSNTPSARSWKSSKVHNEDSLDLASSRKSNSFSFRSSTSTLLGETTSIRPEFVCVESKILKHMFTDKDGAIQTTLEIVTRSAESRKQSQQNENEAILKQTEEQGRINSAKLRYLSCIAHDLKTPLQSFCYTLDLLQQTELLAEQRGFVEQANVAVDLMKLTISQTMDISKALTGAKLMPRRNTVFVSSVLSRVEIIIAGFGKEVPLSFEIAPTINDEIITDEEWLWQMLLNLLTNACKYTDKGSITVRVSLIDRPARESSEKSLSIPFNLRRLVTDNKAAPEMLLFEVIDTGVGVNSDKLSTMFDAFSQVQEGQVTGTGLGLYGVRMRAEGLQGTCGARHNTESCTGTGTVMWFTIPYLSNRSRTNSCDGMHTSSHDSTMSVSAVREATATTPSAAAASPSELVRRAQEILSSRPLTAMVVEDTLTVRKLMERMLLQMGFAKVVGYENGSKGLDAMMAEPVDIVFSDVQMPIMTGPEMVSRFRKFEEIAIATGARSKRQVIVAITANGSELRDHANSGFNDVYPKPLGRNDIYKIVDQLL